MKIGICVFVIFLSGVRSSGSLIDSSALSSELRRVAEEGLGLSDIQKHYDALVYTSVSINGTDVLQKILHDLNQNFDILINGLKDVRAEVEKSYSMFTDTPDPGLFLCCEVTGQSYNLKYRSEVNLDHGCVSSPIASGSKRFPPQNIVEKMRAKWNENPNLLNQYFGGVDGSYMTFPAVKFDSCTNYDPRYKQYYVGSATPKPKDVVIVIDRSKSMNNLYGLQSLMVWAREAANTVLDTLGPNDRIGVVTFSNTAATPSGADVPICFGQYLSMVTQETKTKMKSYINTITADGSTNYEAALRLAFSFFKRSNDSTQGEKRDQVILFLTDGNNVENLDPSTPLEVIESENCALTNKVIIFTYGLGIELSEEGSELLRKMAGNGNVSSCIQQGRYERITNAVDLRSKMASFYSFFSSQSQNPDPIFSVPYVAEFSKIGLIMSLCLQAYGGGSFLGVVCTDIKLGDLLSDVTYFQEGEMSYAFIIDSTGRTVMHPLLPAPIDTDSQQTLLDIYHLERLSALVSVIESMKRRESGSKTVDSYRTIARGRVIYNGIRTIGQKTHYVWGPVASSPFSLCVAIGDGDSSSKVIDRNYGEDTFFYHRIDLYHENWKYCRHYSRKSTLDRSVIKLTPKAFKTPSVYIDQEETQAKVQAYSNYFRGIRTSDEFKEGIRDSVTATYEAENIWKNRIKESNFLIWRYLGIVDGVFRIFPAFRLPHLYDHTVRTWWRTAVSSNVPFTVTAPYLDAGGAGVVITLACIVYEGRSSGLHTIDDPILGVLGTDFPLHYVYWLLLDKYPICSEKTYKCILMDDSGFVVIHPDFIGNPEEVNKAVPVHIVAKEGEIALDMKKQGLLTQHSCANFETHKDQYTFRVFVPDTGVDRMRAAGYEIRPVKDTNIFLILKKTTVSSYSCCSTPYISPESVKCSNSQSDQCDCLCYTDVDYNICENTHIISKDQFQDTSPTCATKTPDLTSVGESEEETKILPVCIDVDCPCLTEEKSCYAQAPCSWCMSNQNGDLIDPVCSLSEHCPFGVVPGSQKKPSDITGTTCGKDGRTSSSKSDVTVIVIGVVSAIICVILIIVSIFLIKKCRDRAAKKYQESRVDGGYLDAIDRDLQYDKTKEVSYKANESFDEYEDGNVDLHFPPIPKQEKAGKRTNEYSDLPQ